MRRRTEILVLLICLVIVTTSFASTVTYDHRAIVIDGKRRVLISGSIHYPRSTPEMWPDLIQKSKDGGLDVIETYVFWNLHEPVRNQYNFEGRNDLVKFVKLVAEAGLYVHLRIGPYVCAEWNYGGFPLWLHFIPGIKFRTDNEPFKAEMRRFTAKIVEMMKQEKLYASQGGPIILSQIENEYGNIDSAYGAAAKPYIKWAAGMAISLDTGVPWVMCQQSDAPDPIINTCNGFYCDQFTPNSNKKPKMWTENWSGWFLSFGGTVPYRPVEDLAFAVARFFQRGGTFQNYYMYHGGTNFDRTPGGPFIATSYDYDAPIDEYGQVRQPKWGHLRDVHKAIKLCEEALIATDPKISSLGPNLEAAVYKTGSGGCSAFLANIDTKSDATVNFNGNSYHLPAWSVSILPDCKNVVLNTAKVNSMSVIPSFMHESLNTNADSTDSIGSGWSWINEPIGISKASAFNKLGLLEQINTTADKSDYLWYSLSFIIVMFMYHYNTIACACPLKLSAGSRTGNSDNAKVKLDIPITVVPGKNTIDLLSLTIGLQNYGAFFDLSGAGITGPVKLNGLSNGSSIDLSSQQWTYQVGLKGEDSGLPSGSSSEWVSQPALPKNQPLIWYKTNFDAPTGNDPVALDFMGMGKGEAWINGQSIGRYWPAYIASNSGCTDSCDYRGPYSANKCRKNCGKPSQQLYHVPRSWLKPSGNILVLFEEMGGDPTQLAFATRKMGSLCSHVSDSHPLPMVMWGLDSKTRRASNPTLSLSCPSPNQVISAIKFASFGTPLGTCGSFSHGRCSSAKAHSIVQKVCVGSTSCSIDVSTRTLGDPCKGVKKSLAVEVSCA
ncbi:Beta-galactosidase 8 -like protein [Gossypium arboreum]|uniref:Beta-galactosidase n=1 Tax=Gossypium arboreum TaxID=29729 RepID=A0A0B0NC25_GOSAR|nr:Beta-galactosidase 8 -like protein [Gossypium arboreum]